MPSSGKPANRPGGRRKTSPPAPESRTAAISRFENGKASVTTATLETLADSLGVTLVAVPGRINAAAEVAGFIRSRLAEDKTASAFRGLIQFSDDLRAGNAFTTALSLAVEPDTSGDGHFDAAIAGLAEIRLAELGLESPAWVTAPSRYAEIAGGLVGLSLGGRRLRRHRPHPARPRRRSSSADSGAVSDGRREDSRTRGHPRAIDRIRRELKALGSTGTIKIIGGTAMILSELADRTATVDIDAVVVVPADVIDRIALDIARERRWPHDWFNRQAQGLYPAYAGHPLWNRSAELSDDTLAIDLATHDALLAMKLNASRRGRDDDDIQALMTVCGVHTVADADQHFSEYFRGESMPDKAVVLLRRLGFPDGDENLYRHIPALRATVDSDGVIDCRHAALRRGAGVTSGNSAACT